MHIDTAVEACKRPAQGLLGQRSFAYRPTCVARQGLEQIELGAGQIKWHATALCAALAWKDFDQSGADHCRGIFGSLDDASTPENRADARN
jgi:hypothetical protein